MPAAITPLRSARRCRCDTCTAREPGSDDPRPVQSPPLRKLTASSLGAPAAPDRPHARACRPRCQAARHAASCSAGCSVTTASARPKRGESTSIQVAVDLDRAVLAAVRPRRQRQFGASSTGSLSRAVSARSGVGAAGAAWAPAAIAGRRRRARRPVPRPRLDQPGQFSTSLDAEGTAKRSKWGRIRVSFALTLGGLASPGFIDSAGLRDTSAVLAVTNASGA